MAETTDPTFYRTPGRRDRRPAREPRLRRRVRPRRRAKDAMTVIDCDPTRRPTARSSAGASCPPPATSSTTSAGTPARARSATRATRHGAARAPLPDRPRPPVVAHLHPRHQARPAAAPGRARDRGRGAGRQGRLLPAPHPALRPGRHLHVQPGRRQRQRRARRRRPDRPRHLRRHRRLGARPRRAVLRLRRLVAPEPRHRHHLGVGDAVDDRERPQPRGPARPLRPPPELLEHVRGASSSSGSTSATSTRWCSSSGPAHDPRKTWGFVGVVISVEDLSASVWLWHQDGDRWAVDEGHHHPGRAGRPRPAPAGAAAVRRGAAAGHRHRPLGRRPLAVRLVLGHRAS